MSAKPSLHTQRIKALQTARQRGLSITEAVKFGYTHHDAVEAGFTPAQFKALGKKALHLKHYNVPCIDMLGIAWPVGELKTAYGKPDVDAALRQIHENDLAFTTYAKKKKKKTDPPMAALKRVPPSALRRANCTVQELKDAGFPPGLLKSPGAWWTDDEKELVNQIYDPEQLDQEFERRARANQVDFSDLGEKRDEFLEAAARMYSHRMAKRAFKKGAKKRWAFSSKTLAKLKKDNEKWVERVGKWKNRQRRERALRVLASRIQSIETLEQEKATDKEDYERIKKDLVALVEKRIKYLKDQRKVVGKKIKAELARLLDARLASAGQVVAYNNDALRRCYPLYNLSSEGRRRSLRLRKFLLGEAESVDLEKVWHPSDDQSKGDDHRDPPLENIAVVDRKIEMLTWSIREFEAETELLKELERLISSSKAIWSFVDKIEKWHPRLLHLANSVTTATRSSQILKKAAHKIAPKLVSKGKWTKRKRITGKRDFALEFGLSIGATVGVASVMVGLSIVVSGSLRIDDDRRMRANLSIKLIPNFKADVKGASASLVSASAKLGFTITNQTYAFVDEKHFAYYMAFRIANLCRFTDKFTRYGNAALHQHFAVYDDDLKKLLKTIVGQDKMDEMEFYLSKRAVWKVHTPTKGKFIPSTDLGFKEGVVGTEANFSHSYTLSVMQRQRLLMPTEPVEAPKQDTSKTSTTTGPTGTQIVIDNPAPPHVAVYDGPRYWECRAAGDGHCAYNSIAYLLQYYDLADPPPDVAALRRVAATKWRQMYDHAQRRGREFREEWAEAMEAVEDVEHADVWLETREGRFWQLDNENYDSVDDFVTWQRDGQADPTDARRHWANAQIVAAIAAHYNVVIQIFVPAHGVTLTLPLEENLLTAGRVLHVVLRGFAHYNALVPDDTGVSPVLPPELVTAARMVDVAADAVAFPWASGEAADPGPKASEEDVKDTASDSTGWTSIAESEKKDKAKSGKKEGSESSWSSFTDSEISDSVSVWSDDTEIQPATSDTGSIARRQPLPPMPSEARNALRPSFAEEQRRKKWIDRRNSPRLVTDIRHGKSWGLAFDVGLKTWLKVTVKVGISQIVRNSNPDNDGFYVNLALTGSAFSRAAEAKFITVEESFKFPGTEKWPESVWRPPGDSTADSLTGSEAPTGVTGTQDAMKGTKTDPEKIIIGAIVDKIPDETKVSFAKIAKAIGKAAKKAAMTALKAIWAEAPEALEGFAETVANAVQNITVGVEINRAVRTLELNFIAVGKVPRLQYVRWTYSHGIKAGGSVEVPVYGPAAVGVSAEVSYGKTVALQEKLGNNTLSYVQTVFNGLKQRIDGLSQWREFLAEHTNGMRKIYKRIGTKPDSVACADAKAFEYVVKQNTRHWKDDPEKQWSKPTPNESDECKFVLACQDAAGQGKLDNVWTRSAKKRFRKFASKNINTLLNLHDKFTTLLWRYTQVQMIDNQRKYPFKRKTVYLVAPAGRIIFELAWHSGGFRVAGPPTLDLRDAKGSVYESVVDILKNPELAAAENALAFYEHGFEVELKYIGLARVEDSVDSGATISFAARQPDGEEMLKKTVMDLVAKATKKRLASATKILTSRHAHGNLSRLICLLRLDAHLFELFRPWLRALLDDKHNYPTDTMPLRTENKDDFRCDWDDEIDSSDETRANWIKKAHQLFDEWLQDEIDRGAIDPDGGGPRDGFEFLLTQIEGPFPGFDNRMSRWQSLLAAF